jgi:hypothetical protein
MWNSLTLKMKALQSFKILGTTNTPAHQDIPENMKLKVTWLEIILLYYKIMGRVPLDAIQK